MRKYKNGNKIVLVYVAETKEIAFVDINIFSVNTGAISLKNNLLESDLVKLLHHFCLDVLLSYA